MGSAPVRSRSGDSGAALCAPVPVHCAVLAAGVGGGMASAGQRRVGRVWVCRGAVPSWDLSVEPKRARRGHATHPGNHLAAGQEGSGAGA